MSLSDCFVLAAATLRQTEASLLQARNDCTTDQERRSVAELIRGVRRLLARALRLSRLGGPSA